MPDDELLEAMRRETRLFMGAVFRENRSILDFIDGRFTFVNGPLARFEQEVLPRGERDYKVTLTKGPEGRATNGRKRRRGVRLGDLDV